ncbi:MAG TPA: peptide-methionine (S)-S-oxide reductase MsrA [Candidatus Paceibacterota bacterium]
MKSIILGGGCFWCIEAVFQQVSGVTNVTSGYAGGSIKNPTYREVCNGLTGHVEVVKVEYDESQVSLKELLEIFFEIHDPTSFDRQGADVGTQYRSIIFYTDPEDKHTICETITEITNDKKFADPIVTLVKPLDEFYPAEDYHQDYYNNNKDAPYCALVISPKLEKLKKLQH